MDFLTCINGIVLLALSGWSRLCNLVFGGSIGFGSIAVERRTKDEHSRVVGKVWKEFEDNGNKDSSDEE